MEFKNPQEELERFRARIAVAGGFVLFCFALHARCGIARAVRS